MNVRVRTLQILEKRFPPEDARAIAEAIDEQIGPSKLLTNDSLKLQLAEVESRINLTIAGVNLKLADLEIRLFNKMVVLGLTGTSLIITAVFFMVMNLKK